MTPSVFVDEIVALLRKRYGKPVQVGRSHRLWHFGESLTCSINYSRLLRGEKFFFGLSLEVTDRTFEYPATEHGDFVILVCGSAKNVLVLPRQLILQMLEGVSTRKLDVFRESGAYILQTTQHPKLDVTGYLNNFPKETGVSSRGETDETDIKRQDSAHVKYQSALIDFGRAEGCSVWVPPNDRGLAYRGQPFSERTMDRLPLFGFDENTRRIVQNIDVLWLAKNVIRKAFEVESTTVIYSGLLRLNDLVLAQPNNQIDLYIVASRSKRQKVFTQLIRPSFHSLVPKCNFFSFEDIDEQFKKIESLSAEQGIRISGLVKGERFSVSESYIYPSEV